MKALKRSTVVNTVVQRVLQNSAYLFSAMGVSAVLSMLQGILVARLLGVENYGILGAIIMFTSVVNKLASFRMDELVVKYVGHFTEIDDHRRAAAVFKVAALTEMVTSCVAYVLIWLLAPLGALYFAKDATTTQWFLIYGLIVLANLISESSTGLLQIFNRFRPMAMLNVVQSAITLALIACVYLTAIQGTRVLFSLSPLLAVVLAYMVGKIVWAVSLAVLALVEAGRRWGGEWWRTPLDLLRQQFRELVRFAISTNLSASLNLINKDSELLWVAFFRNPTEVGYYKLALTLTNLIQMPISPMPSATYPELSREVARQRWASVRTILRQGSMIAGGYTLAASLTLLLLGKPLIAYVYKPEFLPAYPALLILLAGFLVAETFYWRRIALLALGLPEYLTKVNFLAAVLKIIGAFLLIPVLGYLGCAVLLASFYIFPALVNVRKALQTINHLETAGEGVNTAGTPKAVTEALSGTQLE
jgi:O-antigen/teichoic acid export membrane protein